MIRLISLYLGCYCLVICYVNTFIIWKWISKVLGTKADMLPVAAAVVMIVGAGMFLLYYKKRGKYIRGRWLVYPGTSSAGCNSCFNRTAYPIACL